VSRKAQFKDKFFFFSFFPLLGKSRCLVGRSGKEGISLAALSPLYYDELLASVYDLGKHFLGMGISNCCAEGNRQNERRRVFPVLISVFSGFAVRCGVMFLGEKIFQGRELGISSEDYVSPFPAIAAIRPSPGQALGFS